MRKNSYKHFRLTLLAFYAKGLLRMCFGDHDRVLRTNALKLLGPPELVTSVPGFENRVVHLVLGHRSLTAGGKKVPILHSYIYF